MSLALIVILWFITPALRLNIDPRVSGVCAMDRNAQTTRPYLPPEKQDKGSVSLLQTIRDSILQTKLTMKSSGGRAKLCFVTYLLALVKNPAVQITFMYFSQKRKSDLFGCQHLFDKLFKFAFLLHDFSATKIHSISPRVSPTCQDHVELKASLNKISFSCISVELTCTDNNQNVSVAILT